MRLHPWDNDADEDDADEDDADEDDADEDDNEVVSRNGEVLKKMANWIYVGHQQHHYIFTPT